LLALPELDAVIISSTPNVHFAQAKAALERGLHVLIEKPMTLRASESEELIALADRKGVQFLISCPWHYTRHGSLARERLASGAIGEIRLVSVMMSNFTLGFYEGKSFAEAMSGSSGIDASLTPAIEPHRASYSDPATASGGHIYAQASHVFAYLGFGYAPLPASNHRPGYRAFSQYWRSPAPRFAPNQRSGTHIPPDGPRARGYGNIPNKLCSEDRRQ